jgi:SAM-dependent methyltransferase
MKRFIKETLRKLGLLELAVVGYWSVNPRTIYHNIRYWVKGAPDGFPIPPLKLRTRVWARYTDLHLFFQEEGHVQQSLDVASKYGADTSAFRDILDFGCGAGRAIRQFTHLERPLTKAKIYGTDINPDQINWCKRHLSFAEFRVNQALPPLPFDDDSFDLIYNVAVFTHLPEKEQLLWMKEFHRVLKPNGYLLLATCGEVYVGTLTPDEEKKFLAGELVVRNGEQAGSPSTYEACFAYHPFSFVKESLAKHFELLSFDPGKIPPQTRPMQEMDHYLFKKPIATRPNARGDRAPKL